MFGFGGLFIFLMMGFFGIAAGCFMLFVQPYHLIFNWKVVLGEGGEIFEIWRKPDVDLYVKIYLFNITNKEQFLAGEEKLRVEEVGPYVYKEELEHTSIIFNDNGTLSAIPKHPLIWQEHLSEGRKESDTLVLPNIALLSIGNVVSKSSYFTRLGLNTLIRSTSSEALVAMTAKEFMFGYESSLVTLGNSFLPGWIKFDKLGLIDRMYDFDGDYETVFTGETNPVLSGLLDTYRGSTGLPQWKGEHCASIQYASDGTKFMGGLRVNQTLLFYRKSMCRAAPMKMKGKGVKDGLTGYKYAFVEDLLDNGEGNPDNKCFCRNGQCLPSGLLDVADCYYGFPIALSYPHFSKGNEELGKAIDGLKPNASNHGSHFWIQPESGLPLDVSVKFQINMALDDLSGIRNTEKFTHMVLPLLWFDIRLYKLSDNLTSRFSIYLNVLPVLVDCLMWFFFVTGVLFVTISVYKLAFKVVFRRIDASSKKQSNIIIGTDLWIHNESRKRNSKRNSIKDEDCNKNGVYAPCEIPLNDTNQGFLSSSDSQTDNEDAPQILPNRSLERRKSSIAMIKELGTKFTDKVTDTVGTIKEFMGDEISHIKNIFENPVEGSSKETNFSKGYSNNLDSCDSSGEEGEQRVNLLANKYNSRLGATNYQMVPSSESEDDHKYLEVLDDGSEFDNVPIKLPTDRRKSMEVEIKRQRMNMLDTEVQKKNDDVLIKLPDLKEDQIH